MLVTFFFFSDKKEKKTCTEKKRYKKNKFEYDDRIDFTLNLKVARVFYETFELRDAAIYKKTNKFTKQNFHPV